MDEASVIVDQLADAILTADSARSASVVLAIDLRHRDDLFGPVLEGIHEVLPDYSGEVASTLALAAVLSTTDAATAAYELGAGPAAMIDQQVLGLALSDRLHTWVAEVVWHLGEEVEGIHDHRLVTIETLCQEFGLSRPTAPDYLFALASALGAADAASGGGALADLLCADEGMCALVPALLAAPNSGRVLSQGSWAPAIAEASAVGMIDRDTLLDLVLAARSNEPAEQLRWFLELHSELDPTNPEMLARSDAYLRLLDDSRPSVQEAVFAGLRNRDRLRPLATDLLVRVTRDILERGDEHLIERHADWMRSIAGRTSTETAQLAVALGEGIGVQNRELAEHTLDTLAVMLDSADIDTVETIRVRLQKMLTHFSTPRAQLVAERLGLTPPPARPVTVTATDSPSSRPAEEPVGTAPSSPSGARHRHRAPLPNPVIVPASATTLPELAQLAADYLRSLDPLLGEAVLDSVAFMVGSNLPTAREQLHALADELDTACACDEVVDLGLWLGENPVVGLLARLLLPSDHPVHTHLWRVPAGPAGALTMRAQEVFARVTAGHGHHLLALPTDVTGKIAPEILVSRLREMAAAGFTPWPMDLEQALLRTHCLDIDPSVIGALMEINSPAARTVERRLRSSLLARPAIRVSLNDDTVNVSAATLPSRPGDGPLTRHAFDLELLGAHSIPDSVLLTLLALPHHREVAAAYLLRPLARGERPQHPSDVRALHLLGRAAGRAAAATELCLLFGAASGDPLAREAATVALIDFARSAVDARVVGNTWASATNRCHLDLELIAETLTEVAKSGHTELLVFALSGAIIESSAGRGQVQPLVSLHEEKATSAPAVRSLPTQGRSQLVQL